MISNAPVKNIAYYTQEFAKDDYYNKGQNPEGVGKWSGKALEKFDKLEKGEDVNKRDFNKLVVGLNPDTGDKLNRYVRNVGKDSNARTGHDFTLNANKDFTLLMNIYPKDSPEYKKLEEGFSKANDHLIKEIENSTKIRENGKYETCKGIAVATYSHETARSVNGEIDPHKHKHNVVMPYALDSQGNFKAVDFQKVFERKMEIGSECQKIMADTVRELGFKVIEGPTGWQIDGLDRETVQEYSKREAQITEGAGADQSFNNRSEQAKNKEGKSDYVLSNLQAGWKENLEKLGYTPKTLDRLRDAKNKEMAPATKEDVYKKAVEISGSNFFGAQDITTALKQLGQTYKVDEKKLKDQIYKEDFKNGSLLKDCGPEGKFGKPLHTHKSLWSESDFNKLVENKDLLNKSSNETKAKTDDQKTSSHLMENFNKFHKKPNDPVKLMEHNKQRNLEKNGFNERKIKKETIRELKKFDKTNGKNGKVKKPKSQEKKAQQQDKKSAVEKLKSNAFVQSMVKNDSKAKIEDPKREKSNTEKMQSKSGPQETIASVGTSMSSNARSSVDSASSAVAQANAKLGSMSVSDPNYMQALLASYQAQATLQNALAQLAIALRQEAEKLENQRAQERKQYQMT